MAKQITQYDLLVSCPSDVKEELEIIEEVIKDFNRTLGSANGCRINVKHWSTDAYPSLGDSAQNKINQQVVNSCDMAIVILWTRFGTPTQEYGSGTEEEIEIFVKKNKQVFLYFSDIEISMSKVDISQYEKVKKYREKIEKEQKGMHWSYDSKEKFRKMLSNHISMHFISIIEDMEDPHKLNSSLIMQGIEDNSLVDFVKLKRRDFLNTKFMNEVKDSILKNIDEIKSIKIEEKELLDKNTKLILDNPMRSFISEKKVIVDKDCIEKFKEFLELYYIEIDENEFFYLGNLIEERTSFSLGAFGIEPPYNYKGTNEEKKKNELLQETILKIEEYLEYKEYFEKISDLYYFEMALSNVGKTFDEDIDVKIFIRKGLLVKTEKLPIPKNIILDTVNNLMDILYKSKTTHKLNEYPDYYFEPPIFSRGYIMQTKKDKIQEKKSEYKTKLDKLFCYNFFEDEEFDIISYNQSYIKQNIDFLLPSLIYVKDKPSEIKYEIRSKHFPDVMSGTLKVEF